MHLYEGHQLHVLMKMQPNVKYLSFKALKYTLPTSHPDYSKQRGKHQGLMQPAAGRPQRQKLPAASEEQQGDSPASCNGSGTDTSDSGGNIFDGSAGGLAEAQPASPHDDDDDGMGAPDIAELAAVGGSDAGGESRLNRPLLPSRS